MNTTYKDIMDRRCFMNNELKQIKKIYGEDTMKLCRTLFPTILEHEGLLSNILAKHFAPTKFLAKEIIKEDKVNEFKNYIYGFYNKIGRAHV